MDVKVLNASNLSRSIGRPDVMGFTERGGSLIKLMTLHAAGDPVGVGWARG